MVGVIGPTRMAYQRVIPVVQATAQILSGALKATGALAPKGSATTPPPRPRSTAEASDHPINPKIIGTPQDAQLNAALDFLGSGRRAQAR